MTQFHFPTIVPADTSGTELAAILDSWEEAVESNHAGTSVPSYAVAGMIWPDYSFDPPHLIFMEDASTEVDLGVLSDNAFSERIGTITETAEIELPDGYLWCDGAAVSRSTYANLFNAITKQVTGDFSSSATTISDIKVGGVAYNPQGRGLLGAKIEGTNIQAGTTITAVGASTLTISLATTGAGADTTLRIIPWGNGNGSTTFNVPDKRDRTSVGRGDMGQGAANRITTAETSFDTSRLGNAGGVQSLALSTAQLAVHSHTASTSGSTDTHGGHTHGAGSLDTASVAAHNHTYFRLALGSFAGATLISSADAGSGRDFYQGNIDTGNAGGHSHNVTGSTATGGSHSHVLTLSTTVGNAGSGSTHSNVQPSIATNFIIKT